MISRYLALRLELTEPALLSRNDSDPNSAATLDYVPGAAIRGAVAAACVRQGLDLRSLVLGDEVRYLNAYPAVGEHRSLPMPRSFRQVKNSDEVVDWAGPRDAAATATPTTGVAGFATFDADRVSRGISRARLRMHIQRDRDAGTAWRGSDDVAHGTPFSYRSLDAGQIFTALVHISADGENRADELLQAVKAALGADLQIGRARSKGYGGACRIVWGGERDRESLDTSQGFAAGDTLRAVLTSDAIIRNPETGEIDPARLAIKLADRLDATPDQQFVSTRLVGGFNRTWGMALPQALAASMGSVVTLGSVVASAVRMV